MLQIKSKKLLLGIGFFALFNYSFGQNIGDFKSNAAGNFNAGATWLKCVSAGTWVGATATAPTGVAATDGAITITHAVTVTVTNQIDQATINAGGSLIVNSGITVDVRNGTGVDLTINTGGSVVNSGTITPTGTISFLGTGLYQHSFSSAAAATGTIPVASWASTSTCEILSCGNSTNGPAGLNTATAPGFGNFTWNNTTQTVDIFLLGSLTTVNGNFTCTSTNASKLILKSSLAGGVSINISGSFLMSGGNLVLMQVSAVNTNYLLSIGTSFTQNGGTLTIANCSGTLGGFTGNGTLTVGTLSSITNGTLNVCSSTWVGPGGNGTFNATGVGGLSISGTGVVNGCSSSAAASTGSSGTIATTTLGVSAGATLNLNTSTTTGGGGSTTLNSSGLITLNGGTINGSGATGAGITGCSSTINANLGLTISSGTLNLTPGSITGGGGNGTINVSGGALTITGGTINVNSSTATAGTIGSNGTIAVTGNCAINTGTPIINVTSSTTTGGGGSGTITVTGTFIMSSGTLNLCSTSGSGTGNGTLDVDGAFTLSGASTAFSLTSSTTTNASNGKGILNCASNFTHTTASTLFTRTATLATATGTININGTSGTQQLQSTNGFNVGNTITFNVYDGISGGVATIPTAFVVNQGTTFNQYDNGLATTDLTVTGTFNNSGIVNIQDIAILDMGTVVMSNATATGGFFNLLSSSGIITKHAGGIAANPTLSGCIQVTGGRAYSSGADYTYNSSTSAQVTGTGLPTSLVGSSNLTINNTFFTPLVIATTGVTLSQATTTVGTLTLTKGKLNTTSTNLLTLGAAATSSPGFMTTQTNYSFVDGPIKKIGNTSFVFPTGDAYIAMLSWPLVTTTNTVKWARIEITAPTNASDEFTAEYHKINDPCDVNQAISNSVVPALNHVSYKEYWDLNRVTAAASAPTVTLYWEDGNEGTSLGSAISSPTVANLTVAEYYSATWNNLGAATVTGGVSYAPGTVKASLAGTFTTNTIMNFTFGAPTAVNPLPIELLTFNGTSVLAGNQIDWSTASETNSNYFELERSGNGSEFTKITSVNGAGNSTATKNYQHLDTNPSNEINYYRLKQVDYNGEFSYSNIIAIDNTNDDNTSIQVYPNPSNDVVNIVSSENIASYTIYNAIGEAVYSNASEQQHIQFNPLSKGIYVINAVSKQGKTITTRFVKN